MSYKASVYKVFIASPSDVSKEREVIRSVISRWNAINSDKSKTVLLPIGWDTHGAPETGYAAQEYINEYVLDDCDILIGVFWSKTGSPTKKSASGTIEEIERHISKQKLAMLYFSQKPLPFDVDTDQLEKLRVLKKTKIQPYSLYCDFVDENDLYNKLYDHLQIQVARGKFRPTFDSDILAKIADDNELITQIQGHFPLVAKNLLKLIVDEDRSEAVWDAIVEKLERSPTELREVLLFLARGGAFRHRVFDTGYPVLAKCSQPDFGVFIQDIYSINKYEFYNIYKKGLLEDGPFAQKLTELIKKREEQ